MAKLNATLATGSCASGSGNHNETALQCNRVNSCCALVLRPVSDRYFCGCSVQKPEHTPAAALYTAWFEMHRTKVTAVC